jgi:cytochrome c oxidase assembly protein subunit 15
LLVELAQGVIGFAQYFSGLPAVLVGIHMFGACLVWIAAVYAVLQVRTAGAPRPASQQLRDSIDRYTDNGSDHGAVEPDELKVPSDLEL